MSKIVIFGAQAIALGTYKAIAKLYPERQVLGFLVSKIGINSSTLGGLEVREIDVFSKSLSDAEKKELEIWIATPEPVMPEIETILEEYGFYNYKRVTSELFAELMGAYFRDNEEFTPLSKLSKEDMKQGQKIADSVDYVRVFMAKFYKDKQLTGTYSIPKWVTPIQVGAALCEERVAEVLDCEGENISKKNVNYSELTALYWIWKNELEKNTTDDTVKYYGLAHYRRMLSISEEDVKCLMNHDVDAVLPYPMPYEPNIHAHHERYIKDVDWNALLRALEELQPEYAKQFPKILSQPYIYNYNIILAKKEILRDYCRWLFPILERTEELSVPKGCDRADRYIGYMGETLSTLYFMLNKERFCIVHAGCSFFV